MKTRRWLCAITILASLATFAPCGNAQDRPMDPTGLPPHLALNADQQTKLKEIGTAVKTAKDQIMARTDLDDTQKIQVLKTLVAKAMEAINTILTPEQRDALLQGAQNGD